jgi:hypothetical protein
MVRARALRIAAALLCGFTLALAAAWMTFQRVPSWYRPQWLSRTQIQSLQRDVDASFEHITRQLAAGDPTTITMSSRQLNDLLAARAELWPAAGVWPSPDISALYVSFEARAARVGLRHHWGSIQSVWSATVRPAVDDQTIALVVEEVRAGSWPVPAWLWPICNGDGRTDQEPCGLRVRNRFNWPNGSIPFSVAGLELMDDELTIRLEPQHRGK